MTIFYVKNTPSWGSQINLYINTTETRKRGIQKIFAFFARDDPTNTLTTPFPKFCMKP